MVNLNRLASKTEARKHQRPPLRVAVCTIRYADVSSPVRAPTPYWLCI